MKKILGLCIIFALSGCSVSQQEVDINKSRQDNFRILNEKRTYQPVSITGITRIEGKNITITTTSKLDVVDVPDIQYDTSDTDVAMKALSVLETGVIGGAAVLAVGEIGDAMQPVVVDQPAPLVVDPVIVETYAPVAE